MTLQNLVGISLDRIAPAKDTIRRLLDGAARHIDHQTAIQTLPTTLGVDPRTLVRLDALRKQRNLTEYTGDIIPDSAVMDCLAHAQSLYALTLDWLESNKRELL
jgi:hypothetical protein